MNRRTFAASLGTLAGGSAAAVGTGAFSSVTADRNFDVTVSGDAGAYLGLEPHPGPNGNYAEITTDDTLAINITGNNSNVGNGIAGGQGININGASLFLDVFRVTNQGSQDITVDVQPLTFVETNGNTPPDSQLVVLLAPALNPTPLTPGDFQDYNIVATSVEDDGEPDVSLDDQITINAEEV